MQDYRNNLEKRVDKAYEIAEKAKKKGKDPKNQVEVRLAEDLADRVENLIGVNGLSEAINKFESKGYSREKICLKVSDLMAEGELGDFDSPSEIADAAVRSAVAILTEGVVAAPIEGISEIEVEEEGYLRISYSGPIRSAGGTAQVISVLVADYIREKTGINKYEATENEVERYVEEIPLYKEIANLQYTPTDEEIRKIIGNCPILIDGEATEDEEVSGQRNLDRIETNRVRGGMCLVVAEGIALKAPKLQKLVKGLGIGGWDWLDSLVKDDDGDGDGDSGEDKSDKYLRDLIAGRPVFSHPSKSGGFRLRYGRSRNSGMATVGINPATMRVLDSFLSAGTQVKIQLPGKAAGIVPVTSIDGPVVKLNDGTVVKLNDEESAKDYLNKISEIIDVGEVLINYGDFLENNHKLEKPSFTEEFWRLLADKKTQDPSISTAKEAIDLSREKDIPLHPEYLYQWNNLSINEVKKLRQFISEEGNFKNTLNLPTNKKIKRYLELICLPHKKTENTVTIDHDNSLALIETLGLDEELNKKNESNSEKVIDYLTEVSGLKIFEKAPTRVGCRMGRPEKSKERKMRPPTHILFPVGEAGGKERSIEKASEKSTINVEMALRECPNCNKETYLLNCPNCNKRTKKTRKCPKCDIKIHKEIEECPKCNKELISVENYDLDISKEYKSALNDLNERNNYDKFKGVKGLTSKEKTPEPLEKGILRAKHGLYVFKDGTIRYDLTDLPLTHFKPKEIHTNISKLKKLGYKRDIYGNELTDNEQVLELKPQDVILSEESLDYFLKATDFIDDLLEKYYNLPPYYQVDSKNELIGELLLGLAPHTSAGVVSRLIGYTKSSTNYAHPYFHAAKRRNCFHPDTKIVVNGKATKISQFVEKKLENGKYERDDFGNIYQKLDEEIMALSISKKGKVQKKRITHVSKHFSTNHLMKIVTENGSEIRITPRHDLLIHKDGVLEKKPAFEIEEGDRLPTPVETKGWGVDPSCKTSSKEIIQDDIDFVKVKTKQYIHEDIKKTYSVTVKENNTILANNIFVGQCDGDEDCYMLLMDGLLNFSRDYLPETTGGSMDAPLILTSILDPKEVDDEAHNLDIVDEYPLKFYKKALKKISPDDVEIEIGEDRLDTNKKINGFNYTHETRDISSGPKESAYKTLGPMIDKMDKQLSLAKKTRAVEEEDVAERVIESHFLPDLLGNLRAFSTQKVRCVQCNEKYRRPPLSGKCKSCGGDLTLTVHENSVKKYLKVSREVAEKYEISDYIKERLEILDLSMESLFENDLQKGLSDFM
ncbi:MAG: Archaeal DNA polymerase II large subunit [Candidatus Methanohalarchaeum thermophilum]|uniref:DNA polymerase II large subunit n=1 Tax=Methanohalarchaeum thermophilum TaxID=1903181 RepID=A0A1Q6DTJ0_METT1|nr:MAG: Archaeal DNA polymerase II large subunit [Candidatus Methanohalarchaeum thermophilum]